MTCIHLSTGVILMMWRDSSKCPRPSSSKQHPLYHRQLCPLLSCRWTLGQRSLKWRVQKTSPSRTLFRIAASEVECPPAAAGRGLGDKVITRKAKKPASCLLLCKEKPAAAGLQVDSGPQAGLHPPPSTRQVINTSLLYALRKEPPELLIDHIDPEAG